MASYAADIGDEDAAIVAGRVMVSDTENPSGDTRTRHGMFPLAMVKLPEYLFF
jgi:hypothetical protein